MNELRTAIHRRSHSLYRILRLALRDLRAGRPFPGDHYRIKRHAALVRLFHTANRFLREAGVDYWLHFGTLLGYYREGAIMMHDTDIDLGLPEREAARVWRERGRLPAGFKLRDSSFNHHGPKMYIAQGGWEVDLYFFAERDGSLYPFEKSRNPGDMKSFEADLVFPLKEVTFLGEATFVPRRPPELLEHIYGNISADAVKNPLTGYYE